MLRFDYFHRKKRGKVMGKAVLPRRGDRKGHEHGSVTVKERNSRTEKGTGQ